MFGLTGAQDYWCSTLVKGVIYGSYSVTEMFPKNYTNCTWTLENPDPTKYSIYLKLYKRDLSCSEYSLLAYQFDHYSHEKINELLRANESIVYLCDAKNVYVFLLYDKNFVQLRRVFPYDYNGLTVQRPDQEEEDEEKKSMVEFLVLNKASPSQFGCQVLCTWLENCLKLEKGTVETCGIVYTKCTCPQHLGDGESESVLVLNNVVLPLNAQTEGCLSPQLQAGQTCNLSAEVKRPPKEGEYPSAWPPFTFQPALSGPPHRLGVKQERVGGNVHVCHSLSALNCMFEVLMAHETKSTPLGS